MRVPAWVLPAVLGVLLLLMHMRPQPTLRPLPVAEGHNLVIFTSVGRETNWFKLRQFPPTKVLSCPSKQDKPECIRSALGRLDPETYVIWVDSDVLFSNWTEERVISTFESFETEIVLGVERMDWPSCETGKAVGLTDYHYDASPNSGFMMGKAKYLDKMHQWMEHNAPVIDEATIHPHMKEGMDQYIVQLFWRVHRNDTTRVRADYNRKLVVALSDWTVYHALPNRPLDLPWYYSEICGERTWNCFTPAGHFPCWTSSLHRMCIATRKVECSAAYAVDGCRVYQRRVNRRPVSWTAEVRALEGDWRDELMEFLPERESFIYHGNGGGRTFGALSKLLESSCRR